MCITTFILAIAIISSGNISVIFLEMDSVLNITYICAMKRIEGFLWVIHIIRYNVHHIRHRETRKNSGVPTIVLFNDQRRKREEPAGSLCPHRNQMFTCCRY